MEKSHKIRPYKYNILVVRLEDDTNVGRLLSIVSRPRCAVYLSTKLTIKLSKPRFVHGLDIIHITGSR